MTGPQTMLGPEARERTRALAESELGSISSRYGLDLGARETRAIVDSALRDMRTAQPPEVRQRVESALLDYYQRRDPARATTLYNQMEGGRYFTGLNMENVRVTVGGRDVSLGAALDECARLGSPARAQRFAEITAQVGERFRVRGEPPANLFGLGYDVSASDPAEALTTRGINCFSGSIVLGQLTYYMAGRAGVPVTARVQPVASYTTGGGTWDDTGHAILRVDIAGRPMFFDSTNARDSSQGSAFELGTDGVTLRSRTMFSNTAYRLGAPMALNPSIVETARRQDQLFDNPSPSAAEVAAFPPLFLSYFVTHISEEQQRALFRNFDFSRIQNPGLRYRLSATAAVAFHNAGDDAMARRYGTVALEALGRSIQGGGTALATLPMGSFLNTTMDLIEFMGATPQGARLIESSRVWAYLPYALTHSTGSITPAMAGRARDFLTRFYETHQEQFARERPLVLATYASGILMASRVAGSGTAASDSALTGLYSSLGIDRQRLTEGLASNARRTVVLGVGQLDVNGFLASAPNRYEMERSFLMAATLILNPEARFSLQGIGMSMASLTGAQALMGQAVYRMINPESESSAHLSGVLLASGPMRDAARRRGLLGA